MQKFGELIRIARWRRRISQREIAKKIGVSTATVGNWERGQKEPGAAHFIQIVLLLDLPWERVRTCFDQVEEDVLVC